MSFVSARGLTFHVQRLGHGPPVVMLHGLLVGSLASWYFTTAPALSKTHEVLLYDLRGHGKSERTSRGYDLATMAGDLEALTAELGPMTLVGHSYGALIALRFALEHPQRVHRLVLVEAPLPPSRYDQFREFLGRGPEQMIAALPAPLQAMVASGKRQARRLVDALGFLVLTSSLPADVEAEADVPDAELRALSCPVHCIYGEASACLEAGQRIAAIVPRATLDVLPGGHFLHADCAALLTETIVRRTAATSSPAQEHLHG